MKYKCMFLSAIVLGGFFLIFPLQSWAVSRGGENKTSVPIYEWDNRGNLNNTTMDWPRGWGGIKLPPRTPISNCIPGCNDCPTIPPSQKTGGIINEDEQDVWHPNTCYVSKIKINKKKQTKEEVCCKVLTPWAGCSTKETKGRGCEEVDMSFCQKNR